jgi:hypothetical protein
MGNLSKDMVVVTQAINEPPSTGATEASASDNAVMS